MPAALPNELGALDGLQSLTVIGNSVIPGMSRCLKIYCARYSLSFCSRHTSKQLHILVVAQYSPPGVNGHHSCSRQHLLSGKDIGDPDLGQEWSNGHCLAFEYHELVTAESVSFVMATG